MIGMTRFPFSKQGPFLNSFFIINVQYKYIHTITDTGPILACGRVLVRRTYIHTYNNYAKRLAAYAESSAEAHGIPVSRLLSLK